MGNKPKTLYGNSRELLEAAERKNELLAQIAGETYTNDGNPSTLYNTDKALLAAANKENEFLEAIADGGGAGVGANKISIDYGTDVISLKKGDKAIADSGATLPAYGVSFDPSTGGLTLTKNGTAISGQTVTIPNYGSPVAVEDSTDMADHDTIYLYEGTTGETYTNGHFYYWDGAAWADGGEYAAATVQTDKTLLVEDRAADAKAVGGAVADLKTHLATAGVLYYPLMTNGYAIQGSGEAGIQANSAITDYIPVIEHSIIYLYNLYVSGARAVTVYNANKEKIVNAIYNSNDTSLLYTIPESGAYIRATAHVNEQVGYALVVSDMIGELLPLISTVDDFVNLKETVSPVFDNDGYIKYADGSIVSSQNYKYSDPFYLTDGALCVECADDTPVAVIASTDAEGASYTPLVAGLSSSARKKYTYTVSQAGYFCVSYRVANGAPSIWVERDGVETILDAFHTAHDAENKLDDFVKTPVAEIVDPVEASYSDGYISVNTDTVVSSQNYKYSAPVFVSGGLLSVKTAADLVVSVISKTNEGGTFYQSLVGGQGNSAVRTYQYYVADPGYYSICYRAANGVEVSLTTTFGERLKATDNAKTVLSDNIVKSFVQKTVVPNYVVKAFKTLNYSDGTLPKYSQVLWNDPVEDTYYVSANLHSDRVKVFTWDYALAGAQSNMYQAVVLPNGDVLFVYQTQFDHSSDDTAEGAYRKNPILYQAENGFTPVEIDFGDNLKPTGWLQNVGAHYSYTFNRLYISEYTRANEAYAHVWAVDLPVTDISNWHVLLEKEVEKPYGDGFKHFHTAQEDPFTNILYFSSGDEHDSSQVWYSTDGAATALAELDDPNQEKYRMLNMAFTQEYVYWASDQWNLSSTTPQQHCLWKCSRDQTTGILDVENGLTKILSFDDEVPAGQSHAWVATYATVYFPMFNALMFLDRDDHGEHKSIPVRIYDIDGGTLHTAGVIEDITDGSHTFGFRNVAVLCYPKSNEVAVSYDAKTPNYNKLLGNTNTGNRINNLVMRIYKNGTDYSITFDTVY